MHEVDKMAYLESCDSRSGPETDGAADGGGVVICFKFFFPLGTEVFTWIFEGDFEGLKFAADVFAY